MMDVKMVDTVQIREVGPRDGFQNEPEIIPTGRKVELIDMLARTGLRRLEVTSFVRPDVIPQLADAEQVLAAIDAPAEVSLSVLIPNERGLERALQVRERHDRRSTVDGTVDRPARPAFDEVNVFLSASETHNRKNVNRSIEESLASLEGMLARARAEGLRCEGVISTSFGCPYEGHVPPERVLGIAKRLRDAGAQEIGFGDTTGMANPVQVGELFENWSAELGDVQLTAHFHNTRGQGLANVLAALQADVTSFESSFGELGGCPVPAGATGNIASEDLVSMLHGMNISTGIDLEALLACSQRAQDVLGRPLGSHTLIAGPIDWREGRTLPSSSTQRRDVAGE
jgi:hydroxymethylglutaryl-CoA lyase